MVRRAKRRATVPAAGTGRTLMHPAPRGRLRIGAPPRGRAVTCATTPPALTPEVA